MIKIQHKSTTVKLHTLSRNQWFLYKSEVYCVLSTACTISKTRYIVMKMDSTGFHYDTLEPMTEVQLVTVHLEATVLT